MSKLPEEEEGREEKGREGKKREKKRKETIESIADLGFFTP